MTFDTQTGDRGVLIDLDTGSVVDAVRGDVAAGWYEAYVRTDEGRRVSRTDGMGWLTFRVTGKRLRWLPGPRPGQEPLPLSNRFWDLQGKAGYDDGRRDLERAV